MKSHVRAAKIRAHAGEIVAWHHHRATRPKFNIKNPPRCLIDFSGFCFPDQRLFEDLPTLATRSTLLLLRAVAYRQDGTSLRCPCPAEHARDQARGRAVLARFLCLPHSTDSDGAKLEVWMSVYADDSFNV